MSTTLQSHVADPPATPPSGPDAGDSRALRVVSILAAGLPAELGTPDAPERYTVPVVFSRQVTAAERERIEDPETARRLVEATGDAAGVALAVDDRRLLVHNTSLAMLRDGLAAAIGQVLREIGQDLLAEQDRATATAEARQAGERDRARAVAAEAAEISFSATGGAADRAGSEAS